MTPMTDAEVMAELRSDSPLNRARAAFSGACGAIEQAGRQRRPAGPIEIRRMEFEAVRRIADALAAGPARHDLPEGYALSEIHGGHVVARSAHGYHVFDMERVRHGVTWETPEQARRLVDLRNGDITIAEFGRLEAEADGRAA